MSVPQTPKSVASAKSSEPVPSKRRRKPLNLSEPAANNSTDKALQDGKASKSGNAAKKDTAAKAEKKAPATKFATQAAAKSSHPKANTTPATAATHKGAVPAKRRRRQPSTKNSSKNSTDNA